MRFSLRRKDSQDQTNPRVGIVIISGACCIPSMAPFDEQAKRVVAQALAETGMAAEVKVMPATTAFFGGVPRSVMAKLLSLSESGQIPVPAILIDGKPVSYGVPQVEDLKSALFEAANAKTGKKE